MNTLSSIALAALALTSACQTINRVPQSVSATEERAHEWSRKFSNPATLEAFSDDLVKELTRRVRKTSRSFLVYHYGSRETGRLDLKRGENRAEEYRSPVELEPKEAVTYFREWSGQFRSGEDQSAAVGAGVYAAVDPIQSESYAGANWFLMELNVPAGTYYLDLRPGNGVTLSIEFVTKWLQSEDVVNFNGGRFGNQFLVDFKNLVQHKSFAAAVKQTLRKLNVDAIVYSFSNPTFKICKKIGVQQGVALSFINPNFLDRAPAPKIFVQNLEAGVSGKKRAEYSRIFNLIQAAPLQFYGGESQSSTIINGVSTVQKTFNAPRWNMGYARIRVVTNLWAKVLGIPNRLRVIIKSPADADKLFAESSNSGSNSYSGYELNLELLKVATVVGGSYNHSTYNYDPLAAMKKETPAEYQKLVARIKAQTFGCSEKYPEENETPDFN